LLDEIASQVGGSFFAFDAAAFCINAAEFADAFSSRYPMTEVAYSYKTNYTPAVCQLANEHGLTAEVVSQFEYQLARHIGVPGTRIIFNGPAKSRDALHLALLEGAQIHADSLGEVVRILDIAQERDIEHVVLGIRCNLPLESCPDSRFGIDTSSEDFSEAVALIRGNPRAELGGLHCHFPARDLDSFRDRAVRMVELASKWWTDSPDFLDIGGGFYGRNPPGLGSAAPTFSDYAEVVTSELIHTFGTGSSTPRLILEPGTALVADSFRYYVRVFEVKDIRGRSLAMTDGSLLELSPHSRSSVLPARIVGATDGSANGRFDVSGYTCIEGDYLSRNLSGIVEVGDWIEYSNVGSYTVSMKPPFIRPASAIVAIDELGDSWRVLRHPQLSQSLIEGFEARYEGHL
jgi:diaminopimelate decarboxylase